MNQLNNIYIPFFDIIFGADSKINPQGSVAVRKIQGACQYLGSMTTWVKEPRFTISSRGGCMRPPSHLMHTPIICDNVYSLMVARCYNAVTASFQFESDVVLHFITWRGHSDTSIMILVSAPLQLPEDAAYHVVKHNDHSSQWTVVKNR